HHRRALRIALEQRILADRVAVQERGVDRIEAAFERLQVIAFLDALAHVAARLGHAGPFVRRLRRALRRGTEVRPDHAALLDARIGCEPDLLAEAAFQRLRGNVHALPRDVVLPAVVRATQPLVLVAAEPQAHAAMGAELVDEPDA